MLSNASNHSQPVGVGLACPYFSFDRLVWCCTVPYQHSNSGAKRLEVTPLCYTSELTADCIKGLSNESNFEMVRMKPLLSSERSRDCRRYCMLSKTRPALPQPANADGSSADRLGSLTSTVFLFTFPSGRRFWDEIMSSFQPAVWDSLGLWSCLCSQVLTMASRNYRLGLDSFPLDSRHWGVVFAFTNRIVQRTKLQFYAHESRHANGLIFQQ